MTDVNPIIVSTPEAAPIAAPESSAPEGIAAETTNPIKTAPPDHAPAKVEVIAPKPRTARDSLADAKAKMDAAEKAAQPVKAEAAVKPDATVKTDAKVDAAKPVETAKVDPAKPVYEPPQRWKPETKAKFSTLDDDVKQEITRTISELEKGYVKHKEAADKWTDLKEFEDIAAANKVSVKDALKNYTALEKGLASQNPSEKLAALEEVFRVAKVSPKEYAAHIMGQTPDQNAVKSDATVRKLESELAGLKQQLQAVVGDQEKQAHDRNETFLNDWAKDKPMVDDLAPAIAEYVQKQGLSLDDAYAKSFDDFTALAARAGFTPAPIQAQEPVIDLAAQTLKGKKAIAGAPSLGSYPATQKPSNSAAEAVKKAFAQLG